MALRITRESSITSTVGRTPVANEISVGFISVCDGLGYFYSNAF